MATSLHSKGEKPDKCKISYFSKTNNFPNFPQHELDTLARCLYPAILAYFESEEGKREFAQWEAQQEQNSEQRQYLSDTAAVSLCYLVQIYDKSEPLSNWKKVRIILIWWRLLDSNQ